MRSGSLTALLCLLWLPHVQAAVAISSARIWPSQEYTRLTLESAQPIRHHLFTLQHPERLVIDLEEVEIGGALNEIAGKIGNADPYIQSARVGRFKPGVVRLVLDLKTEAKPQLFSLKPVGEYGHRLVLDVYPAASADPLMALALKSESKLAETPVAGEDRAPAAASAPALAGSAPLATQPPPAPAKNIPEISTRILVIAIDAGHGGEDPGARGHNGTNE